MTRDSYLRLMAFPVEWSAWGMLPEALIDRQIDAYEPGHEAASEHDRHGAFQWWLRQEPTEDQLVALARLSWLDPDAIMGAHVRQCIAARLPLAPGVAAAIASPYHRA